MSFNFHYDRKQYFQQQFENSKKYIIPFITKYLDLKQNVNVLEIGSGEGGILKAFFDLGCNITGIDLAANKIINAIAYYSELKKANSYEFFTRDIFDFDANLLRNFDLIILKDTIEHIHDQNKLMKYLSNNIKENCYVFIAFPPWQMPYGGHQQICDNKLLSLLPYIHLLPNFLYTGLMKIFKENDRKIINLLEVKQTRISIERFERIVRSNNFKIVDKIYYFINPNYEIKFGLKPRKQMNIINKIPYFRNFLITTCFYLLKR